MMKMCAYASKYLHRVHSSYMHECVCVSLALSANAITTFRYMVTHKTTYFMH